MTDDPLEGADIGETATVTEESELWLGDYADFEATVGSDRIADHEVVEIEPYTDEHGDQMLRLTVESEVTKTLPHRWATGLDPADVPEDPDSGRGWLKPAIHIAVHLGIVAGILLVLRHVVNTTASATVTFPAVEMTVWDLAGPAVVLTLLVTVIVYGLQGGLPRRVGGRR
jgi:hypothetical protein